MVPLHRQPTLSSDVFIGMCRARGVGEMIRWLVRHHGLRTQGLHCVVVGKSAIVGQPVAQLPPLVANPFGRDIAVREAVFH